jgi:hypothetical protein
MREALNAILTATLREHIEPGIIVAHTTVDRQAEGDPMALVVIGEPGTAAPSPASEAWGPFQDLRGGLGFRLVLARAVIEAAGGQVYSKRDGGVRAAVLVVLPLKETLG